MSALLLPTFDWLHIFLRILKCQLENIRLTFYVFISLRSLWKTEMLEISKSPVLLTASYFVQNCAYFVLQNNQYRQYNTRPNKSRSSYRPRGITQNSVKCCKLAAQEAEYRGSLWHNGNTNPMAGLQLTGVRYCLLIRVDSVSQGEGAYVPIEH